MPTPRSAIALIAFAALTACDFSVGSPDATDAPAPAETVTVTETVTAEPGGLDEDPCIDELKDHGFIFVTSPTAGQEVESPFQAMGCSNTFEATLSWRLLAGREDQVLAEGFGTATAGSGQVGTFTIDVEYTVPDTQIGTLEVFENSPEDGSVQLLSRTPLLLRP